MGLRILRAFAWLRWRILLNAFERQGARDVIQRFSTAFEQLVPVLVLLMMVPSALALAVAGGYAGWLLAAGEPQVVTFELLRFVLFGGTVFALVGPIVLPAGDRTNVVRLLLLPIPRGLLYLAQAISAAADPWVLLVIAVIISIPIGLVAGGAGGAAAFVAAAGLAFVILLVGVALVVTSIVQLVVRDRRRGEILTLIFIIILPMIGIIPGLWTDQERPRDRRARGQPHAERSPSISNAERIALAIVPSEIYVNTTRTAASGDRVPTGLFVLIGAAAACHGLAYAGFTRMLASPGTTGRSASHTRWGSRLPGVSSRTSAVALAQLKLGLRTPRGRSTILSPIVLFLVFAAVMFRSESGATFGFIALESGIALASFTSFVALLSTVPLAFNQFAIDSTGLTLMLLAPIETRSLLTGKALGSGLIAAIPVAFCLIGSLVLFPRGDPALWISVPLTLVATYLLVAPAAAAVSAIFPKAVDMNSMGRSNAHGTAGFLGTLLFLLAGAPSLLLVLSATRLLERPWLAPAFLLVWIAICALLSGVLFKAAAALFERRRDSLGMVG